ncbi:MAG: HU family DNA-binding protein, partial [Bacteroidales bacterium]|nr:HU family DNA-binding protein [Bacteroidales bacterium]
MGKVSVAWIAEAIAGKHGLTQKDAEQFVATFFDLINEALHEEKMVKVKGLGTFKVIDVRERESINVNTGERVVIESHGKISFTP